MWNCYLEICNSESGEVIIGMANAMCLGVVRGY